MCVDYLLRQLLSAVIQKIVFTIVVTIVVVCALSCHLKSVRLNSCFAMFADSYAVCITMSTCLIYTFKSGVDTGF